MSSITTLRRSRLGVLAVAAAVVLALPAAAAATVASPIRAVFLKEFSKPSYQMDRGQLLILENDDPFLIHGLAGALLSSPALPGKTRLVRNSPFLTPGVYPFHDPLHPEMASSLTVNATGTPPPPDTVAPSGSVKVLAVQARKFAKSGKVRVRVTPSEAVDVDVNLFIGKQKVATNTAAFADPVARVLSVVAPLAASKKAGAGTVLTVRVKLTDVTGKLTKKRATGKLGSGGGKKKGK